MKRRIEMVIMISFVCLLLCACGAKGETQQSGVGESTDATATEEQNSSEPASPEDALGDRKIYIYDGNIGFAVSDKDAASIIKEEESEDTFSGGSVFYHLVTEGKDIKDPESGVTFVVSDDLDKVYINERAAVYVIRGENRKEMLSGNFSEDEFSLVGTISTSYGDIDVYTK